MKLNDWMLKYVPKMNDVVKIKDNPFYKNKVGIITALTITDKGLMANVRIEEIDGKTVVVKVPVDQLQPMFQPMPFKDKEEAKNQEVEEEHNSVANDDDKVPVALNHLVMPTKKVCESSVLVKNKAFEKYEVVNEINKFLKTLETNGWSVDSINIELSNKENEEEYVIVHL